MVALAAQNRVREVPAVAVFTFFVVIGALVVLLVAIPGLADLFDQASRAPLDQRTISVGLATGILFIGLWGIASRRMRLHSRIRELEITIQTMRDTMERQGARVKLEGPDR